jgi:hypothetical protein
VRIAHPTPLIYAIPNHNNPKKPHQKGINASEWDKANKQIIKEGEFTPSG